MSTHITKYIPPTSGDSGYFGWDIGFNDTYVLVGEYRYNSSQGRVVLYPLDNSTSTTITGSDTTAGDYFGGSVFFEPTNNIILSLALYSEGFYNGALYCFNLSGTQLSKIFRPGDVYYTAPAQLFSSSSTDLSGKKLTIYPYGIGNSKYTWELESDTTFYSTTGHTVASFSSDNDSIALTINSGSGNDFEFYGTSYSSIYLNTNGNITFNAGDTDNDPTWSKHFSTPRISFAYTNFLPKVMGTIRYGYNTLNNTDDLYVITYSNVWDGNSLISIQVILHLDNSINSNMIQIIYAGNTNPSNSCIIGISNGSSPSDISSPGIDFSTLPELNSKNSYSEASLWTYLSKTSIISNPNYTLIGSGSALGGNGGVFIFEHNTGVGEYYPKQTGYLGHLHPELQYFNDIDDFGKSLTFNSNNYFAVGAPASYTAKGAVFVYKNTGTFELKNLFIPPDGANYDRFGHSISMNSTYLAVGSFRNSSSGAVYIYEYTAGTDTWAYSTKIKSTNVSSNSYFGFSVSINSDNIIAVGVPTDDCIILFKYISNTWTEIFKITASDPTETSYYGSNVAITTNNILVSDYQHNSNDGAVYRYSTSTYCYHKDTNVLTDKGYVNITLLERGDIIKTLNGYKPLARNIELISIDKKDLVLFKKNSLGENIPNEDFRITQGHPVYYKGDYYNPEDFANNTRFENVIFEEINDNKLYHLQFESHEVIYTNNFTTTSLPPYTRFMGLSLPEELYFDKTLFNKENIGKHYEPYMLHDDPLLCNKLN
jgi:hypothetical protein